VKRAAFSLIELLVVILIVDILVILSFKYYKPLVNRTYNLVAISDLRNITTALEGVYPDNMNYPLALVDNLSCIWLNSNVFVLDDKIGYIPSKDVLVYYSCDRGINYVLATKHIKGDKIFIKATSTSKIYSVNVDNESGSDNNTSIYPRIKLPEPSDSINDKYFLGKSTIYKPM
jgi:type II secretory pathway pseudopilin PulG